MKGNVAKQKSTMCIFNVLRKYIGECNQLLYLLWVLPFILVALAEWLLGVEYGKSKVIVDSCIKISPALIGLCFALMAFLYKMDDTTKQRITTHTNKDIAPVRIFFSMITWFILTLLLVFILALLTSMMPCLLLYAILYGSVGYALCIFVQVILQMFTFHTFFFPLNEEEMKQFDMINKDKQPQK